MKRRWKRIKRGGKTSAQACRDGDSPVKEDSRNNQTVKGEFHQQTRLWRKQREAVERKENDAPEREIWET
ncbi:hypothetical protein NDU88_006523 [Pleurodeles waltl]|uniref:Uncharacterized protein n=1 Tax=Pleurodeles waltl TaxID=8319 RepID=A0AAV7MF76_PLEWA|nr:hypothetical protein NDU88_006523 [Pleurodeles waltl]